MLLHEGEMIPQNKGDDKMEKRMWKVTKQFTGGLLNGLTIEEVTSVHFPVGFVYNGRSGLGSPFVVIAVEEI